VGEVCVSHFVISTSTFFVLFQQRSYTLSLTRSDDAQFYYTIRIDEDEFSRLKHEQNLLVNYEGFAQMVGDLLESVCEQDKHSESKFVSFFLN
jgi:hypothetical protein